MLNLFSECRDQILTTNRIEVLGQIGFDNEALGLNSSRDPKDRRLNAFVLAAHRTEALRHAPALAIGFDQEGHQHSLNQSVSESRDINNSRSAASRLRNRNRS
jgi:hypothetical protein